MMQTPISKLIVIGTSTGGPKALHEVIPKLPGSIPAAVMIVQHMPSGFTRTLAERLNTLSAIRVKEAEHSENLIAGCAYVAPGDYHLTVNAVTIEGKRILRTSLNQDPPRLRHRPSVDVLFESAAEHCGEQTIGVIMTGMGNDGAKGIALIKDLGGITIAEHQSSCVVYGMPKIAIETGRIDVIVPLTDISKEIMKHL